MIGTGDVRDLKVKLLRFKRDAGVKVIAYLRKVESCKEKSEVLKAYGVDLIAFACEVSNPV